MFLTALLHLCGGNTLPHRTPPHVSFQCCVPGRLVYCLKLATVGLFAAWEPANATHQGLAYCFVDWLDVRRGWRKCQECRLNVNCALFAAVTWRVAQKSEERLPVLENYYLPLQRNTSHHWQMTEVLTYVFVVSFMLDLVLIHQWRHPAGNFFTESDCNHAFTWNLILSNYGGIVATDWIQIQEFSKSQPKAFWDKQLTIWDL